MTPPFSSASLEGPFLYQPARSTLQNASIESFSSFPPDSPNTVCVSHSTPSSQQGQTRSFAYVTLLTSLQAVQSKHPLIVMHSDTVSSEAASVLKAEGCIMRPVKPYFPPASAAVDHSKYKNQCYADCWTKLLMWEMEEYELLVYLDADTLVNKNIDHLFHLPIAAMQQEQEQEQHHSLRSLENLESAFPVFWAVPDCAAGRPTEEERGQCSLLPQNIKKSNNKNGNPETDRALSCHNSNNTTRYSYFNAGMFLFRPSIAQLEDFTRALSTGRCPIQGYAEQDFLNYYFKHTWQPLSPLFNFQKGIKGHHPELWVPEEAFIIHYTDCKPWHGRDHPENEEYRDIVNWWWDIYSRSRKDGDEGRRKVILCNNK